MDTSKLVQATILSGAIGYVSLEVLQRHGAVTRYLANRDATAVSVLFGIWDYILFLLSNAIFQMFLSGAWQVATVVFTTVVAALGSALGSAFIFSKIEKSKENQFGRQILTSREQAFQDQGKGVGIRVDIFQMNGSTIASGYIDNYDVAQNLSGDVTLLPLQDGETAAKNEKDVIKSERYQRVYLDFKNSVKYYITVTSLAS